MEEKKTFRSSAVAFTAEFKPNCVVEYNVDVFPETTQRAKRDALRSIAKEVSIPGFRKGRAPDALIIKKFAEPLRERWHSKIANRAFDECQKVSKIPVLHRDTKITVHVDEPSEQETTKVTYTFETKPTVPSIDFDNITLNWEERDVVDEKKVEETLHSVRLYFADWTKISDRAVQTEDYVLIDVDVIEETPPQRALANTRFQVNRNYMAKWMFEIVLGMKIGEVKQGVSIPDDDAPEKVKKDSPPKKVELTLRCIENATLPDLDDDLAKKVGVATVGEMRENIKRILNNQSEEDHQKAYRTQIDHYLIENYRFSVPKTVLQEEVRFRMKQIMSDPERRKMMESATAEEQKAILQKVERQGERALRLFYLTEKMVRDQNIRVSPNEVERESRDLLGTLLDRSSGTDGVKSASREQREIAMSRLLLTKAEDFLISKAKIKAKSVGGGDVGPPQGEKKKEKSKKIETESQEKNR